MKKIVLIILLFVFIPAVNAQTTSSKQELGIKGKATHDYGYAVKGLEQFPLEYGVPPGYVLATTVGSSGSGEVETRSGTVLNSLILKLVTLKGENLEIRIVGSELQLALLMNEISPRTGKYQFWYPIIWFQGKYNDWTYYYHEIDVVGRFFIEWDKKETNKITGYRNEVYR